MNLQLMDLDRPLLIETLDRGLWGGDCENAEDHLNVGIEEQWANHEVCPVADVFDDWCTWLKTALWHRASGGDW